MNRVKSLVVLCLLCITCVLAAPQVSAQPPGPPIPPGDPVLTAELIRLLDWMQEIDDSIAVVVTQMEELYWSYSGLPISDWPIADQEQLYTWLDQHHDLLLVKADVELQLQALLDEIEGGGIQ